MKPIQRKRIIAYRNFKGGFLVLGTGPDRRWLLVGGTPIVSRKKAKESGQ